MRSIKVKFDAGDRNQLIMKLKVIEYNIRHLDKECKDGDIELKWIGNQFKIDSPTFQNEVK